MTGNWNQIRFSLNADADEKYKSDNTFRTLVDMLRAYLRQYQFTPSELRQASMLASTMHVCENVQPLYIIKDEYPYVFGGTESERIQSAVPNQANAPQTATGSMQYDKWSDLAYVNSNKHRHYFMPTGRDYAVCECGISGVYYQSNLYNYKP